LKLLNSLTVAAYIKNVTFNYYNHYGGLARRKNFGWLDRRRTVSFSAAAAPDDSGWRRRRHSAAEGSTC